jgi:hypothetical protein
MLDPALNRLSSYPPWSTVMWMLKIVTRPDKVRANLTETGLVRVSYA